MLNGESRYLSNNESDSEDPEVFTTDEDGKITLNGLPYRDYYVQEITAPKGYEISSKQPKDGYKVKLTANGADQELLVENTKIKTKVTVVKQWVGGPQNKPTVKVQLLQDGEPYGDPKPLAPLSEGGMPGATWNGLDKANDVDGKDYKYDVQEILYDDKASDVYTATVDGGQVGDEFLYVLTNIYNSPLTGITGTKKWVNGPNEKPPIQLQLYRKLAGDTDLEKVGKPETLENGTTTYNWGNLPETDKDGNYYIYTVDEVDVPTNYEKSYGDDGLTVINTYVSPKIDITGTKTWVNGPKERPEIKLQLYRKLTGDAELEVVREPVTLENGKTAYIWTDLPETDKDGNEYTYIVDEVDVPENYIKEPKVGDEDNLVVINTYISPKINVTGKKEWVGGSATRPTIELQLYRDGEKMGELVELVSGVTSYTWTELDETDINGNDYTYTVDEVNVPNRYVKSISEDGLTITNRYRSGGGGTPPKEDDPDPKEPVIVKDVNGTNHVTLEKYKDAFTYNVRVVIPEDVTGYTGLSIYDDLERVLAVKSLEVLVNGVRDVELTETVKIVDNRVSLALDDKYRYSTIAGKTITLVINAELKPNADLSVYTNNLVPNKAGFGLNDHPGVDSDTVTVTVPKDPTSPGDVENGGGEDPGGKDPTSPGDLESGEFEQPGGKDPTSPGGLESGEFEQPEDKKPGLPATGTDNTLPYLFSILGLMFLVLGVVLFRRTKYASDR